MVSELYLIAYYLPTALFSLKDSQATNAAAKTLLVPSPYAVKMALLDAAIHWRGLVFTKRVFEWIKTISIRAAPPRHVAVSNTFVKIQRPPKKPKPGEPLSATVAFREYAHLQGEFALGFEVAALEKTQLDQLQELLLRINYFGKRGCFFQFLRTEWHETLGLEFTFTTGDARPFGPGVTQYLDDFGVAMTWEMADTFDKTRPQRETTAALIPLSPVRSSRGSTLYRRTDE
ncbi:hypothetical protein BH24DEI2_BH24DEI2_07300 [soil metagenome]